MLTAVDTELFPDDCEVVEIPDRDLRIYLIQKNGSSSLRLESKERLWNNLKNHEISSLDSIDVYLRDPRERYLSGVNTFVQHTIRDNPGLDKATCEYMALHYAFLNRHYLPQWHWMVNLARFLHSDCVIRLHTIKELENVTKFRSRAKVEPYSSTWPDSISETVDKLELWFLLDKILLGHCGEELTWSEILSIYHDHPTKPLEIVTQRFQNIIDVLCPT